MKAMMTHSLIVGLALWTLGAMTASAAVWPNATGEPMPVAPNLAVNDARTFWDWNVDLDFTDKDGVSFDFLIANVDSVHEIYLYAETSDGWFIAPLFFSKVGRWDRVIVRTAEFKPESGDKNRVLTQVRKLRLSVMMVGPRATTVRVRNFGYATSAELARPRYPKTSALPMKPGEWRAFWCINPQGLPGRTWDETVDLLKRSGFNALLVNLARGYGAFYPSKVLPVDGQVAEKGDMLKACLAACRKHGVECHVWKMCWWYAFSDNAAQVERMKAAGRTQVSDDGTNKGFDAWLCPTHLDNLKLEVNAFVELAQSGVDGVHLDYIRYPYKSPYCFCPRCLSRFEKRIGRALTDGPREILRDPKLSEEWTAFRSANITRLVRAVSKRVRAECPGVKISAAVFEYPQTNPTNNGQDWPAWCREKLVDFVCPMDYYMTSSTLYSALVRNQRQAACGVPVRAGIGTTVWDAAMSVRDDAEKVKLQIRGIRAEGLDGFSVFGLDERTARMLPFVLRGNGY